MDAVTKFLSQLNERRAFVLFFIALFLGTLCIFSGWLKPFSPAIPVLAYGAILVAAQRNYYLQLGPNLKDSPYFLGFILSLVEILYIVLIGFPEQRDDGFLFREIGSAVITTAVGLFMRQYLLANDRGEEAQDRMFRSVAEEVRKDVGEFHDTQKHFVKLVQEFTLARENMFSTEEKAFNDYLKVFRDAVQRLGALPKRIDTLMAALEKSGSRIAEISSGVETGLSKTAETFRGEVDGLASSFASSRKQVSDETQSLARSLSEIAKQLDGFREIVTQTTSSTEVSAKAFTQSIGNFSANVDQAGKQVDALIKDLSRITADLGGIDQVTDDLIRVLRDRLSVLADAIRRERSI